MRVLNLHFIWMAIVFMACLASCKPDASSHSEEEAAYMADYEAPDNKWGFIDQSGNLVIEAAFDDVGPFSEGLSAVNKNGKWGYIDKKGELVIPAVYKSAWAFHEGFARVLPFDGPDHFITPDGTILGSDTWAAADDFSNGRARVLVGNLFGYIDTSAQLVIQPIYSRGWNFENEYCIIEYHDKVGVIDLAGETIIPSEYDQIKKSSSNNFLLCRKGNTSIVLGHDGKEYLKVDAAKFVDCSGESISVRDGNKMYLTKLNDSNVKSPEYTNIIYLDENLWAGKLDSGYLLINSEGVPITDSAYTQINKFIGGFAAYSDNNFWGYLDTSGRELTGEIFGLAWDYREGFARAAFQEGIAFINSTQQLAFYPPAGTIDMRDFSEGLASVQLQ